jgi:hypothetical protein
MGRFSMHIYEYRRSKGYEMLLPIDDDGFDRFARLNGKPQGPKKWKPIRVKRVRATRREGFKPSDAPFVFASGVLVFRRSAVDALRDILDAYGELLPLEDEGRCGAVCLQSAGARSVGSRATQGWRDDKGALDVGK